MGKSLTGKELGTGITQRKDGRYQARYTNRFGKRKYMYDDDLKQLQKRLRAEMVANDNETNVIDNNVTLNEWFDMWQDLYKSGCRNSTKQTQFANYKRIKASLGDMKLSDIKVFSIQKVINSIESPTSQKQSLAILKNMLDKAVDTELIVSNPAKKVVISKREIKKEKRVLTKEETKIFLQYAKSTSSYLMIVLALRTGMRIGEVVGLTWDDVDFKNRMIHIRKTLCVVNKDEKITFEFHDTKTDSGVRSIPMLKDVHTLLKMQYEQKQMILRAGKAPLEGFENLVFVTRTNKPVNPSSVRKAINTIVEKINRENPDKHFKSMHPHTLRHTFATRCIENGMQPKTLQKILGHSSIMMTMDLYCHVTQETINSEMSRMEELNEVV